MPGTRRSTTELTVPGKYTIHPMVQADGAADHVVGGGDRAGGQHIASHDQPEDKPTRNQMPALDVTNHLCTKVRMSRSETKPHRGLRRHSLHESPRVGIRMGLFQGFFLGIFLQLFPYPGPLAQLVELLTFNP